MKAIWFNTCQLWQDLDATLTLKDLDTYLILEAFLSRVQRKESLDDRNNSSVRAKQGKQLKFKERESIVPLVK